MPEAEAQWGKLRPEKKFHSEHSSLINIMNIGFDFDKVFIDYPPFLPGKLFDKLYKKKDNGTLLFRIPEYPEQILRKALHLPFILNLAWIWTW